MPGNIHQNMNSPIWSSCTDFVPLTAFTHTLTGWCSSCDADAYCIMRKSKQSVPNGQCKIKNRALYVSVIWDDPSRGYSHYVPARCLKSQSDLKGGARVSMRYSGKIWTGKIELSKRRKAALSLVQGENIAIELFACAIASCKGTSLSVKINSLTHTSQFDKSHVLGQTFAYKYTPPPQHYFIRHIKQIRHGLNRSSFRHSVSPGHRIIAFLVFNITLAGDHSLPMLLQKFVQYFAWTSLRCRC